MTEQNKRKQLTVSKLGASALKAGARQADDNHGQTTNFKFEDCAGELTTYYNDTATSGKTISK